MVGALGVVYGDIGTSPLYALRECFNGSHPVAATHSNILGVLSLIFWSLMLIVSVKYLSFVLRADNHGEGGILSLMSLAFGESKDAPSDKKLRWLVLAGVFGSALLYGDGMITPSISVLSAVEGLEVATPAFRPYIVPITVAILIVLFAVQRHGTGVVGLAFGPVTFLWFLVLAVLGVRGVLANPQVLAAVSPHHAVAFLLENSGRGFMVLGAVFLVVTGAEALYADLGHFGARPIRRSWFLIVLPALLLNYFGQGALLLVEPQAVSNPFYRLAPTWALYPLAALAMAATVIASQALISGAYSLSMQALQLGYLPRMEIRHTSAKERGQIYLPTINRLLLLACIGLVLGFRSSSGLAAAYGVAVTLTMLITTLLFYVAARRLWNWSRPKAVIICGIFFAVELAFFAANIVKIEHGGWFPLLAGLVIFTVMTTWKAGREQVGERLRAAMIPLRSFLENVQKHPPSRVKGTAIFMSGNPHGAPLALLHNLKHNRILHEHTVILTIVVTEAAHVSRKNRVHIESFQDGVRRIIARYGFMDQPSISDVLSASASKGVVIQPDQASYFLSRETILPPKRGYGRGWKGQLFAVLARNAQPATAFFQLPANRVVELGMQVQL